MRTKGQEIARDHYDYAGGTTLKAIGINTHVDCVAFLAEKIDAAIALAVANANLDLRQRFCDAERLIAWLDDPERKPANTAFTAGNERQIAYRVEGLRDKGVAGAFKGVDETALMIAWDQRFWPGKLQVMEDFVKAYLAALTQKAGDEV